MSQEKNSIATLANDIFHLIKYPLASGNTSRSIEA